VVSPTGVVTWDTGGTVSFYLWGAQLEAGAFATSYIPTIASTVTRSADVAAITGSLFSQWYAQPQGTWIVAGDYIAGAGAPLIEASVSGAVDYQRIALDPTNATARSITSSTVQALLNLGAATTNINQNIAFAYQINNFAATLNGGTAVTDTAGSAPTLTTLYIGRLDPANDPGTRLNGHIRSIRYVPVRAADFQLQQVTT
jgi:hypothetical protein